MKPFLGTIVANNWVEKDVEEEESERPVKRKIEDKPRNQLKNIENRNKKLEKTKIKKEKPKEDKKE